MNKIILTGNLTKEISLTKTLKGDSVATTTIAVNREYKINGEYKTDFFNLVAYKQVADYLNNYAYKGGKIELCGRLETREYETKDGVKKLVYEVIIENANMLTRKQVEEVQEEEPRELPRTLKDYTRVDEDDDDLPF